MLISYITSLSMRRKSTYYISLYCTVVVILPFIYFPTLKTIHSKTLDILILSLPLCTRTDFNCFNELEWLVERRVVCYTSKYNGQCSNSYRVVKIKDLYYLKLFSHKKNNCFQIIKICLFQNVGNKHI